MTIVAVALGLCLAAWWWGWVVGHRLGEQHARTELTRWADTLERQQHARRRAEQRQWAWRPWEEQ